MSSVHTNKQKITIKIQFHNKKPIVQWKGYVNVKYSSWNYQCLSSVDKQV